MESDVSLVHAFHAEQATSEMTSNRNNRSSDSAAAAAEESAPVVTMLLNVGNKNSEQQQQPQTAPADDSAGVETTANHNNTSIENRRLVVLSTDEHENGNEGKVDNENREMMQSFGGIGGVGGIDANSLAHDHGLLKSLIKDAKENALEGHIHSSSVLTWLIDQIRAKEKKLKMEVRYHEQTDTLLKGAELLQLKKRLKPGFGGGLKEFVYEEAECFVDVERKSEFLTSQERSMIVKQLLEGVRAREGGERFFLTTEAPQPLLTIREGQPIVGSLISQGFVANIQPLHNQDRLQSLRDHWVMSIGFQPLEQIREYFGTQIGLYFAWLGHYTGALCIPASLGVMMWWWGITTARRGDMDKLQWVSDLCFVGFALFNCVWATVWLEWWKRRQAELSYSWGTLGMEQDLLIEPRTQYMGDLVRSPVTGRLQPEAPAWKRRVKRYCISYPIIFCCILIMLCVMMLIFKLQEWFDDKFGLTIFLSWATFLPKILLGVVIFISDETFMKLARQLNDYENYRTDEAYDNNLIIKIVTFQFVNSFLALFYIAFYLQDMNRLSSQLAALLITRQVIGNISEAAIPYIKEKVKLSQLTYQMTRTMSDGTLQRHVTQIKENAARQSEDSSDVWGGGNSGDETSSTSNGLRRRAINKSDVSLNSLEAEHPTATSLTNNQNPEQQQRNIPPAAAAEPGPAPISPRKTTEQLSVASNKSSHAHHEKAAQPHSAIGGQSSAVLQQDQQRPQPQQPTSPRRKNTRLPLPEFRITGPQLTQAELESLLPKYSSPLEDYLEMFIQLGYVLLFSPAFPLAAVAALANNLLEIRVDAFKLCNTLQRPFARRVESVGTWMQAMEFMGMIGVMVNCALIGQSGLVQRIWPDITLGGQILFVVILEHVILCIKYFVSAAIPDVPNWVTVEMAKVEFKRREALKRESRLFGIRAESSGDSTSPPSGEMPGGYSSPITIHSGRSRSGMPSLSSRAYGKKTVSPSPRRRVLS